MKISIITVTTFLVWFAVSLHAQIVKSDITQRFDTKAACGAFMKPTGIIKSNGRMVYVECRHKTGSVKWVAVRK